MPVAPEESWTLIEHHVKPESHYCDLPGWWKRRKLRLGEGTVIECKICGRRWKLEYDTSMESSGLYWARERTPEPTEGPPGPSGVSPPAPS